MTELEVGFVASSESVFGSLDLGWAGLLKVLLMSYWQAALVKLYPRSLCQIEERYAERIRVLNSRKLLKSSLWP